jgi:MEDS: MEthanogen/methylotroph, DcmR Sensory domain
MSSNYDLHRGGTEVFWGEIAPCEHLVQIYENEGVFLDTLEGFVSGGLKAGDSVIIIATVAHLNALEERLRAAGFDVEAARSQDQYIALVAEEVLAKFMVRDWPDDELFRKVVSDLLTHARKSGRKVRAFGEMVAVLWAQGATGATVRLEHLWQALCQAEEFSLFCAYPKVGFTQNVAESISEICAAHTQVLPFASFNSYVDNPVRLP